MPDMKFCIDCEHFSSPISCYHPNNMKRDLVTGDIQLMEHCASLRKNNDACGQEAKWFYLKLSSQQKEPLPPSPNWRKLWAWAVLTCVLLYVTIYSVNLGIKLTHNSSVMTKILGYLILVFFPINLDFLFRKLYRMLVKPKEIVLR